MKTTKFFTYCLLAAMLFMAPSCSKTDKCANVTCQNGGTCNDGSCNCAAGYEGTNCETGANAKFVGTYTGTLTVDGNPSSDVITITAGTSGKDITLSDPSLTFGATVSATNVTINARGTVRGTSVTLNGTGNLTNGNTLTFTVTAAGDSATSTMVYQGVK